MREAVSNSCQLGSHQVDIRLVDSLELFFVPARRGGRERVKGVLAWRFDKKNAISSWAVACIDSLVTRTSFQLHLAFKSDCFWNVMHVNVVMVIYRHQQYSHLFGVAF